MRDGQVMTCLSNLDCVTVGGIISAPHPISMVSLSEVLEPEAMPRYFLSPKAAQGILRRAAKRGRDLPPMLQQALEALAVQHGAG